MLFNNIYVSIKDGHIHITVTTDPNYYSKAKSGEFVLGNCPSELLEDLRGECEGFIKKMNLEEDVQQWAADHDLFTQIYNWFMGK
jgi:hypothetical protein